jgi:8-amino-7-oxononanoate synthase
LPTKALYPVAALGVELARARGAPVHPLPHLAPIDSAWLRRHTPRGWRPIIVTDGLCSGCGQAAPLACHSEAVAPLGGLVVVDDTQALGLLGASPSAEAPFGIGGGGSLRYQSVDSASLIVGASLAKSFGVPIACLVGPARERSIFVERSDVRLHMSPPSRATLCAAEHALREAARTGAERRRELARRITELRGGLDRRGLTARGGELPLQSIAAAELGGDDSCVRVHDALAARGVRSLLCRPSCQPSRRITFVLRADHAPEHVAGLLRALRDVLAAGGARRRHASFQRVRVIRARCVDDHGLSKLHTRRIP